MLGTKTSPAAANNVGAHYDNGDAPSPAAMRGWITYWEVQGVWVVKANNIVQG